MALGTDFNVYLLGSGACFKFIATRAVYDRSVIFWVYIFFHSLTLLGFQYQRPEAECRFGQTIRSLTPRTLHYPLFL